MRVLMGNAAATASTGPEIAARLRLLVSTVGRLLKRPGRTADPCYQHAVSGELAHVDTKGLGRFAAIGHRIRGNHSVAGRRTGLGKDQLNVAVDNATRVAYAALDPVSRPVRASSAMPGASTRGSGSKRAAR